MLDANLYTLSFIQSVNEPNKLVLIEEGTGEPVYYRTRSSHEQDQLKLDLFHSLTNAHLASLQNLNHKLKLISLYNPNLPIELKNSSLIHWEWTFTFTTNSNGNGKGKGKGKGNEDGKDQEERFKFSWKRDLLGLKSNRKGLGYTCWLIRKPDPDYPCAIYKPKTSNQPAICQILDFNIQRIEGIQDKKGLEIVMILSLLAFTEPITDHEFRKPKPTNSPDQTPSQAPVPIQPLTSTEANRILNDDVEPNEILINEEEPIDRFIQTGLKLLSDPLLVYIYIHASTPKTIPMAVKVAESIKRTRFKDFQEDLQQYLMDDIMSRNLKGKGNQSINDQKPTSNTLKIYLSRTPLDELLPKPNLKSKSNPSKPPIKPPKTLNGVHTSKPPGSNKKLIHKKV
ncbi:uncharacterized protein MELLADRAFT_74556 [Melampsora larici-populina 98AG31]|uniref:Uncharacterized protein n=1 Tax=Melampsora larici-populina (strain 98AG31 / pathotype 3-4-7) TaxID=747676 RepID=F4RGS8_MELLP|nr:uncharacterized protein MELLADRAFT_74556 [Melampsora larici-populina 98AG31]EGG08340.1 hypothetical protein MELLADRAFT_74556 [Melampsora larici-populina 98AG31]